MSQNVVLVSIPKFGFSIARLVYCILHITFRCKHFQPTKIFHGKYSRKGENKTKSYTSEKKAKTESEKKQDKKVKIYKSQKKRKEKMRQ